MLVKLLVLFVSLYIGNSFQTIFIVLIAYDLTGFYVAKVISSSLSRM